MNDTRQKEVLAWLYDNCSHKWFTPWVLDPVANKAGNPPGNMSWTEIVSVFQVLLKDGYIIPIAHPSGLPVFILNEMRETEWIEKIDSTAPTKDKIVGDFIKSGAKDFMRQLGAGMIGGAVTWLVASVFQG
jgi:hypothetical protein